MSAGRKTPRIEDRKHRWARNVNYFGHNRMGLSLSTPYEVKIRQLAVSCGGMRPTTLAAIIVGEALDSPKFIAFLQGKYGDPLSPRLLPVKTDSGYVFAQEVQ